MAQITPNQTRPNKILLFSEMPLSERTKITVWERHLFKKILINKSFGFVSTLRKKVFSGALVKFFPFYGPSNSDSVVFGNATFAEIKDHSLKTTSKKIDMKVLSFFLPYVKWHCQGHQWRDFPFMAQMIQILLFLGVPFLERSKITVWEWHLLKKRIYYRSFEFLPALCKKVFLKAQVKCFSLYGSHNSDSAVFGNVAVGEIKDHSLGTTSLKNKFAMEVLSCVCLTYKGIFKRNSEALFSLWLKWVILCRFGNANLAEIKDHSLSTINFLKTF